jgi:hypothetical protein
MRAARTVGATAAVQTLRIGKQRDIEFADQTRAIAVADQSRAEFEAKAEPGQGIDHAVQAGRLAASPRPT